MLKANSLMKRKGVSPVVATVLLISIVIVLGLIIFFWARGFLNESAIKGDRAVEVSCQKVEFESEVVKNDNSCDGESALDVNNIGNVPIYGVRILEWNEAEGSVNTFELSNEVFGGTLTLGKSARVCLGTNVGDGDSFRVVPKLLAENSDGGRTIYTCPEKDGITIAFVDY
jgi:flagellin-like protein